MSNLITLDNISLAYGLQPLLDNIKLQIQEGERICLIGRNGAGKSSLLRLIEGTIQQDSGLIWRKPHLRLARLAQELPQNNSGTIYEFVAEGLEEIGMLLNEYHILTQHLADDATQKNILQLEKLQQKIDSKNGWRFEQMIKTILSRLELNPDQKVIELSGGWLRRLALAKVLVTDPELLLLDEPTNHLDIEAIQWLENFLLNSKTGLLFITHDRFLLKRLATRIIELDRGQLTSYPCDYQKFLIHKDELLHAESMHNAHFDKKLAQEEQWIRQGIKARRTRNEGRVRALEAMRKQRNERRDQQNKATFSINETEKSGSLVIDAKHISHSFNKEPIIKDFSIRIMRGDRIGLIGPNGIGKSTLLNIFLGNIEPQEGTIIRGTKLEIAYFDQLRQSLMLDHSVIDNVAEGREFIDINGKTQHIISYLGDFLFTPERALTPVNALSGGECNRLLLAKLFSLPANLLVMDEPTNDLDIETLELLEELLINYRGTLLLVSHDRAFLDNVVTSIVYFSGFGKVNEYIGGYQDWVSQNQVITKEKNISSRKVVQTVAKPVNPIKKISYKDKKELDALPEKIEKFELEQTKLQQQIASESFYKQDPATISQTLNRLKELELSIAEAYKRWAELETLNGK